MGRATDLVRVIRLAQFLRAASNPCQPSSRRSYSTSPCSEWCAPDLRSATSGDSISTQNSTSPHSAPPNLSRRLTGLLDRAIIRLPVHAQDLVVVGPSGQDRAQQKGGEQEKRAEPEHGGLVSMSRRVGRVG